MIEWSTLSASIRIVKLSSPSMATKRTWSSKSDDQALSDLSSLLVLPNLKRAYHSLHRVSLIVSSPKRCFPSFLKVRRALEVKLLVPDEFLFYSFFVDFESRWKGICDVTAVTFYLPTHGRQMLRHRCDVTI
ncbi:hypothetical protein HNY73_020102 [Argiope bruennichi]|uniref:Uncharacterized protein n=1 Tax=Argiope bruennichi TaxID=94029 RepID=A0A8T0E5J6_ARGBR|nr:hypothetical protein HNY73_020102 [Argiope bruennichi]